MTSAEASAECLQWVEAHLRDTLGCNTTTELTPQHHFVINEMLMGEDARYRVLFAYYAEPSTAFSAGQSRTADPHSTSAKTAAPASRGASRRGTAVKAPASGLNRSRPGSDADDDETATAQEPGSRRTSSA